MLHLTVPHCTSLYLTAPHCTSLTHMLNEKSHFYISTCLQMFCFNCAALSSEYKVAHKHTTTRDKGDLDRILDIVYSGYFSHHGITFFQSLTFTTFAMHSVLTNEENIWQLEDCTARLYLNSLSVFIWCELDYSCQSETCVAGSSLLEKAAPQKLVDHHDHPPGKVRTRHVHLRSFLHLGHPLMVKMICCHSMGV